MKQSYLKILVLGVCVLTAFSTVRAEEATTTSTCPPPTGDAGWHKGKFKEKMMEKYDTNKDGKLDDAEKAAMEKAREERKAKWHAKMLKKYDTNKDGKLDATEEAAMKKDLKEKRENRHKEMLEKFDTNKNGVLDPAEREKMREDMKLKHAGPCGEGEGEEGPGLGGYEGPQAPIPLPAVPHR